LEIHVATVAAELCDGYLDPIPNASVLEALVLIMAIISCMLERNSRICLSIPTIDLEGLEDDPLNFQLFYRKLSLKYYKDGYFFMG
jgi:multisubunit Na+/H+ antiporter MnhC subunit